VLLFPAVLIPFFKTGPFAWQGALEFWLAAGVFFGWIVVMTVVVHGSVTRQRADADFLPQGGCRLNVRVGSGDEPGLQSWSRGVGRIWLRCPAVRRSEGLCGA
jgi:hypothetical protein